MDIAVIGTGISGLGAAWALHKQHALTLYEQNAYAGGHSNTVDAVVAGRAIPVDTGFIVYNERNYPLLTRLFATLGVATEKSDMSFAVSQGNGAFEYSGRSLSCLFAQKRNLFSPSFWRLLGDILRFNREAPALIGAPGMEEVTLGDALARLKLGDAFIHRYLLPMGAAIWSSSLENMLTYPAQTFLRFFDNHGLLTVSGQPQWYTVSGGSREYVAKLTAGFRDRILTGCGAVSVERTADGVLVRDTQDGVRRFDQVVIAAHADQALRMIAAPTEAERRLLGAFSYQRNRAVLHRDTRLMPHRRAAWASWNYLTPDLHATQKISLTYWMNLLQNLPEDVPLFVTLNPVMEPKAALTHAVIDYDHPLFTLEALRAQAQLALLQGRDRLWFCGSYFGYGFHEDGLRSGLEVAAQLGAVPDWAQPRAA